MNSGSTGKALRHGDDRTRQAGEDLFHRFGGFDEKLALDRVLIKLEHGKKEKGRKRSGYTGMNWIFESGKQEKRKGFTGMKGMKS
jgi:hypothetical protein